MPCPTLGIWHSGEKRDPAFRSTGRGVSNTVNRLDAAVPVRSNSFVSLVSNLKAGLGLGALPTIIGDAEPELVRCLPPTQEFKAELGLIARE